jgi:hypothetical protein
MAITDFLYLWARLSSRFALDILYAVFNSTARMSTEINPPHIWGVTQLALQQPNIDRSRIWRLEIKTAKVMRIGRLTRSLQVHASPSLPATS